MNSKSSPLHLCLTTCIGLLKLFHWTSIRRRAIRFCKCVLIGHIAALTFLRGKVVKSLNSSKGYPLEATKSKRTWSLQLPRKRLSRNSPLGVRIRSLLICSLESSLGSGGRACSNDKRIACKKKKFWSELQRQLTIVF